MGWPMAAERARSGDPGAQAVYDLMADGEWHSLHELLAASVRLVRPGVAYRAGRGKAGKGVDDSSVLIARGGRTFIQRVILHHTRAGRWEMDPPDVTRGDKWNDGATVVKIRDRRAGTVSVTEALRKAGTGLTLHDLSDRPWLLASLPFRIPLGDTVPPRVRVVDLPVWADVIAAERKDVEEAGLLMRQLYAGMPPGSRRAVLRGMRAWSELGMDVQGEGE